MSEWCVTTNGRIRELASTASIIVTFGVCRCQTFGRKSRQTRFNNPGSVGDTSSLATFATRPAR